MAHRRIGQEVFPFGAGAERPASLDALTTVIDWQPVDQLLARALSGDKRREGLASLGDVQGASAGHLV